jgi:hypothetical protein
VADEPAPPPDEPKPRAKGKALPRTALDIERMSRVADRDIAAARRDWKARAPGAFRGLIDATVEPDEEGVT